MFIVGIAAQQPAAAPAGQEIHCTRQPRCVTCRRRAGWHGGTPCTGSAAAGLPWGMHLLLRHLLLWHARGMERCCGMQGGWSTRVQHPHKLQLLHILTGLTCSSCLALPAWCHMQAAEGALPGASPGVGATGAAAGRGKRPQRLHGCGGQAGAGHHVAAASVTL
jgi:hypothetical protein